MAKVDVVDDEQYPEGSSDARALSPPPLAPTPAPAVALLVLASPAGLLQLPRLLHRLSMPMPGSPLPGQRAGGGGRRRPDVWVHMLGTLTELVLA